MRFRTVDSNFAVLNEWLVRAYSGLGPQDSAHRLRVHPDGQSEQGRLEYGRHWDFVRLLDADMLVFVGDSSQLDLKTYI